MKAKSQDSSGFQRGDKVRLRTGDQAGSRGIIGAEVDGRLKIILEDGAEILVSPEGVTNYSLAARRAWSASPKKAGRPKEVGRQKKMVSIRVDTDIWEALGRAVEAGFIPSR